MDVTLHMVLSPLGYSLVYVVPPVRDPRDNGWSRKGEIYYFSPRDTRWFGFRSVLSRMVSKPVRLVRGNTGSPWRFTRDHDYVLYLEFESWVGTRRQPFCERFLRTSGIDRITIGETVSVVFE